MKRTRKTVTFIFLSVLFSMLLPSYIYAEEQPSTGLISMLGVGVSDQGYFIVEGRPGGKASVTVNLKNVSDSYPASSLLFTSDATVAAGGGMGSVPPDKAIRQDIGAWFKTKELDITLKPNESRDITFNFDIPNNVTPGEHVGQIALYKFIPGTPVQKNLDDKQSNIYVNKAYTQAIAVLVKIPGSATHKMSLTSLKPDWVGTEAFLSLTVTDEGNMIEKSSSGSVTITQNGKIIHKQKGELGSIYPGTSGVFSFPVPDNMKVADTYNADVEWKYGDQVVRRSFTFTIEKEDVKNAERVSIANEEAKQGRSLPQNAFILNPSTLWKIGGIAVAVILVIIVTFMVVRRIVIKSSRRPRATRNTDRPRSPRTKYTKRSSRPYPILTNGPEAPDFIGKQGW